MNTWEEIYEWLKKNPDNELYFTLKDDVKSALNYIIENSCDDLYVHQRGHETIDEWLSGEYGDHYRYVVFWIDMSDHELVISLRDEKDVYRYNVEFYADHPFLNTLEIDIDALNSLF